MRLSQKKLKGFAALHVPVIVLGELYYGAYRSENVEKHMAVVEQFIYGCMIMNIGPEVAAVYGQLKNELMKNGKPIPENDMWIAATAMQHDLPLFTTDKHFTYIEGLVLTN